MINKLKRIPFHLNRLFISHQIRTKKFQSEKEVFTKIFDSKVWGENETVSGSGSTMTYTENIRKILPQLSVQLKLDSILDAPCGDFNWMNSVDWPEHIDYLGADIVDELIDNHNQKFATNNRKFVSLNITKDALPRIGNRTLWLCRDCLFHLSFDSIHNTLTNFVRSDFPYLLTSNHDHVKKNTDIQSGDFRLIDLTLPPFNLPDPQLKIDDYIEGKPPRHLALWTKEQVQTALLKNKRF